MTTSMHYHCGGKPGTHGTWAQRFDTVRPIAGINPAFGRNTDLTAVTALQSAGTPKAGGGMT